MLTRIKRRATAIAIIMMMPSRSGLVGRMPRTGTLGTKPEIPSLVGNPKVLVGACPVTIARGTLVASAFVFGAWRAENLRVHPPSSKPPIETCVHESGYDTLAPLGSIKEALCEAIRPEFPPRAHQMRSTHACKKFPP